MPGKNYIRRAAYNNGAPLTLLETFLLDGTEYQVDIMWIDDELLRQSFDKDDDYKIMVSDTSNSTTC